MTILNFIFFRLSRGGGIAAACGLWLVLALQTAVAAPVWVVLSEQNSHYLAFAKALQSRLPESDIRIVGPEGIAGKEPGDLVVAVGVQAAGAMAASDAPAVLNVMVSRATHHRLQREFRAGRTSSLYSAIYLDQPAERVLHLISVALPDRRKVGLLYGATPPDELAELRRKDASHGLRLQEMQLKEDLTLYEALQKILQRSEVLLALPDAAIYNAQTLRNILIATYRNGIPMVAVAPGYVRAGALCAIVTTPEQAAAQAAGIVRQYARSGTLPAAQYPAQFEVMLNEQVARSLGIRLESEQVRKFVAMQEEMP